MADRIIDKKYIRDVLEFAYSELRNHFELGKAKYFLRIIETAEEDDISIANEYDDKLRELLEAHKIIPETPAETAKEEPVRKIA